MRVTSAIWVAAYIRRCASAGAYAVVARRGAESAGAIFVRVDRLDGRLDLYAPAPQIAFEAGPVSERKFERVLSETSGETAEARLERELRFDPDLWIVDVEDRAGRAFLDD